MTYGERASASLKQAEICKSVYPWETIFYFVSAVVMALLAIAVAIEALNREH